MPAAHAQALRPQDPKQDADKIAAVTDEANHLTIDVALNGKGPFRFVVDTGADRSVIATDVATSLGLLKGRQVLVQGIVRTIPATTARVRQISFGPVTRHDLEVPVLPRQLLQADGYLGLDTIDGYRVTLDFKNHALEVREPRSRFVDTILPPNEARIPAFGRDGHLRAVNCNVDGVRSTAFIDTGAEVTAGNPPLFDALLKHSPNYAKFGTMPLTGITGGVSEGRVTGISQIKIGDITFSNGLMAIAPLQVFDIWGLADEPALLIGMDYLRQFSRVSIDYGIKEIRLDLASLVVARA